MYRNVSVGGKSGHLNLLTLVGGGSAVSLEANAVQEVASEVAQSVQQSLALFGQKKVALSDLTRLAAGWDGDVAIESRVLLSAKRFICALPENVPLPEFSVEPDGSIALDWIQSRTRTFSLSIGQSNRLAYAWLDGTDRGHGVAYFDGQNVPSRVLIAIEGIVGHDHPGLWAA